MKLLFQNISYLKSFVGPVQASRFKPADESAGGLVVLAESEEAANHLIDSQVGEILSKLGDAHIYDIHITDQKAYNNYPLWLRASLYIDTSSEERIKESGRLIKAIMHMVDRAVTLRLSPSNKAKAEKSRRAVERIKAKEKADENEEAILQKKREKDQQFKDKLKSLPPDQ